MNSSQVLYLFLLAFPFAASGQMVGGQEKYETNLRDPKVVFAVNATNNYFKNQNDFRTRAAVKLISATSQIVEGVLYRFNIEMSVEDKENNEICQVAVWVRSWLRDPNNIQMGNISCH